jgi:phosphoribosylamine--glycine ligase
MLCCYRVRWLSAALQKGKKIDFGGVQESDALLIYHAGTKLDEKGNLVTNGGRVLGVTAIGKDLSEAVQKAYQAAEKIKFEGSFYRKDIGQKRLQF